MGTILCLDCNDDFVVTFTSNFIYRKAIPLNKNEGRYVRDVQTGKVRAVMGPQAYLLQAFEELYEKPLTPLVEEILR